MGKVYGECTEFGISLFLMRKIYGIWALVQSVYGALDLYFFGNGENVELYDITNIFQINYSERLLYRQ